jgi:dodecin
LRAFREISRQELSTPRRQGERRKRNSDLGLLCLDQEGRATKMSVRIPRWTSAEESRELAMTSTFKKIEVVGTSSESIEAAIHGAITAAGKEEKNLRWFEVAELRGRISKDGKIDQYQVTVRIGVDFE